MIEENIKILNQNGIDARASAVFVQSASSFVSNVWLKKDDSQVNAKSIMSLMSLALRKGNKVLLKVDGVDEIECAKQLKEILSSSFWNNLLN